MTPIEAMIKPYFREQFNLRRIAGGKIVVNAKKDTIECFATGIKMDDPDNEDYIREYKHPVVLKYSEKGEMVKMFMEMAGTNSELAKHGIEIKSIELVKLEFDFIKNELDNSFQYKDVNDKIDYASFSLQF